MPTPSNPQQRAGAGRRAGDNDRLIRQSTIYSLFMQAPTIVAVLRGPDHVFELVNEGYEKLFSDRQLRGRPFREARPELEGEGFFEILDNVYETGQPYVAREARVVVKRSPERPAEEAFFNFVYQPMSGDDGRTDAIIVFAFEVTADVLERRRSEERLRQSEAMFRLLVDSVEDYAIFMLDPEGRVATWNGGARRIKGYERDEIVGRHFSVFYPEEDVRDGKPERLLETARAEGRVEDEGWRVRKDGGKFWADTVMTAIHDAEGKLIGFAKVTRDMTERKNAEEMQRALVISHEVNRAKDEFLAVISHEMRTPLTSILGWARMLRIGGLDEATTQEALDALERSSQAQVHLIEDLLDDTRIRAGKLRLTQRPVEMKSIVESALTDLTPVANAKGIRIEPELRDSCSIVGDPIRLHQVVANIVSNAIKFTDEGGTVSVSLKRNESMAEIEVRDTGRGIEPELITHLFERFRQGDSFSGRKAGIGLGLAISKYLVEQHGGSIEAASEGAGKGSTFTVRLPVTVETSEEFTPREPNRAVELPDLSGIRVLIVEDEADNRGVLSMIIERCGGSVQCADDGKEGLEMVAQYDPDVIVCDIALPDLDGCEFIQQVRKQWQTPALALTVFGSADEESRVRACGFNVFRQKPIEPSDLAHEIARLAAQRLTA